MDERLVIAGWHGIHDGVDDLASGANTGVQAPNGTQVLRPVGHDGRHSTPLGLAMMFDRAILLLIIFQTVVN